MVHLALLPQLAKGVMSALVDPFELATLFVVGGLPSLIE